MKEVVIDAFQCFQTPHVVVGFGRLRRTKNKDDEIQIEVLLLECQTNDPDFFKTASVAPIRIWLGVGKLDLVYCGSTWVKGRRRKAGYFFGKPRVESVTFSNSTTLWDEGSPEGRMLGDVRCFPFSWEQKPAEGETEVKKLNGFVPMAELARAIFGVSSQMLVRMFGGIKSREMAKKTYFYDRLRSGRIDKDTVRLYCWGRPNDTEAVVMAASVVYGPLKKAHSSIFQTIQTSLESEIYATTLLAMTKPFEEAVRMSFQGRWLDVSKRPKPVPGKVFGHSFARINWVVIPTPFTRIEIKNERPEADNESLPTDSRTTVGRRTNTLMVQDERAPNSRNASKQLFAKSSDVYPEHDIEIINLPRDKGGKPFPEFILDTVEQKLRQVSTGDPIPGAGKEISHLDIKRITRKLTQAEREAWAEYEKEFKGIEAALEEAERAIVMGRKKGLWSIPKMEVEEVYTPDGDTFLMLCAEILYTSTSRPILLADAGSYSGHSRAMGIICRKDGNPFSDTDHASMRLVAGKYRGRWRTKMDPNDAPNLMINWVARNNVDGVDAHYKRLSGKLEKLFD